MIGKKELRKEILKRRDALPLEERIEKSQRIAEAVIKQENFEDAAVVLAFASFRSEVDTSPIIHQALMLKKKLYLPKVIGEEMEFYQVDDAIELEDGYFGIQEPKPEPSKHFTPKSNEKIFILMPGAVFDEEGGRIGYGKGFYDRFLQQLEMQTKKENLCKAAIAFSCQIVEKGDIIKEKHDVNPDIIITEEKVYKVSHS